MVKVKPGVKVITIERTHALTIERVVEFFSAACGHVCALKEVDKLVLSSLTKSLRRLKRRPCGRSRRELPKDILSHHSSQFKKQWKKWRREYHVEAYSARPSHPQNKGKVERRVQNLNGEFIYNLGKFLERLKGKLDEYKGVGLTIRASAG